MHRLRLAGFAVLAALAASALASAAASAALPEFKGNFGKLEMTMSSPEWDGSLGLWTYRTGTITGEEASTSTLKNVTVTFTEGGEGCNSNTKTSELKMTGLKARLGYINKAKKEVGFMFEPVKQPIGECTQCSVKGKLLGVFIGSIQGHLSREMFLSFQREGWNQLPQYFEGEKETEKIFPLTWGEGGCKIEKIKIGEKEYEYETCSHKGSQMAFEGSGKIKFEKETELVS